MSPSRDLASTIYNAANVALIVSLIFGAVSTVLIVWMGNVKEGYLRLDLAAADERSSIAENRAAQANLKIAELTTPRTLDGAAQQRITAAVKAFPETPFTLAVQQDPEAINLLVVIRQTLLAAGWTQVPFPSAIALRFEDKPNVGISVVAGIKIAVPLKGKKAGERAADALRDALQSEGLPAMSVWDKTIPADAIQIHIGRKP